GRSAIGRRADFGISGAKRANGSGGAVGPLSPERTGEPDTELDAAPFTEPATPSFVPVPRFFPPETCPVASPLASVPRGRGGPSWAAPPPAPDGLSLDLPPPGPGVPSFAVPVPDAPSLAAPVPVPNGAATPDPPSEGPCCPAVPA